VRDAEPYRARRLVPEEPAPGGVDSVEPGAVPGCPLRPGLEGAGSGGRGMVSGRPWSSVLGGVGSVGRAPGPGPGRPLRPGLLIPAPGLPAPLLPEPVGCANTNGAVITSPARATTTVVRTLLSITWFSSPVSGSTLCRALGLLSSSGRIVRGNGASQMKGQFLCHEHAQASARRLTGGGRPQGNGHNQVIVLAQGFQKSSCRRRLDPRFPLSRAIGPSNRPMLPKCFQADSVVLPHAQRRKTRAAA
jgi:hypothetical protein